MTERIVKTHPAPGFGEKLRQARLAKGINQVKLAEMLGTRKGHVSLWEREKNFPSDANLQRLAELLKMEVPIPERNARGRKSEGRRNCPICGQSFPVFYDKQFCSRACANQSKSQNQMGENAPNYLGGRHTTVKGYVRILMPDHPQADNSGYILEHRYVMQQHLGRLLHKSETVHHKNGNRQDNRIENLELRQGSHGHGATHKHCDTCTCFERERNQVEQLQKRIAELEERIIGLGGKP
jgi:transcriptional regulator with XRE-family HTH domain